MKNNIYIQKLYHTKILRTLCAGDFLRIDTRFLGWYYGYMGYHHYDGLVILLWGQICRFSRNWEVYKGIEIKG